MVALEITEIGSLLQQMLKGTMFDHFLLQEAVISTICEHQIDGRITENYYTEEEAAQMGLSGYRYIPFSIVRPLCLEIMKGRRKPAFFKFVFLLSPENQENTIIHSGCSLRPEDLIYKNNRLTCTTGVSCRIFSMDRTLEKEWDRLAAVFFRRHGITAEIIS